MESEPTRVLLVVSESTIRGYPHASISSRGAFEWTIQKIVHSNTFVPDFTSSMAKSLTKTSLSVSLSLSWVFVGTVSEFYVKHGECPVITIKRRADELLRIPLMIEFVCCNDSFDFEQQLNIIQ